MTKKRLLLALKFLLSAGLIWLLFSKVDTDAVMARAGEIAPGMLALGFLLFIAQIPVAAWRWMVALAAIGEPMTFRRALPLVYIGIFFNQTLPSSVGGDGVRMYLAYRHGMELKTAINGVMLDRIATLVVLVGLVAAMQPFLVARIDDPVIRWLFPLLCLGAIAGLGVLMLLDRLPEDLKRWKLVRGIGHLAHDARLLFLSPRFAGRAVAINLLGHVNIAVAAWFLAVSLSIDVNVIDCIVLIPPVLLVTTLPISIAGWGVRESAMVGAFGLLGVTAESALVLSLLFGLTAAISSLPGGILFLLARSRGETLDMQSVEAMSEIPLNDDENGSKS